MTTVSVLGGGAWGTALALTAHRAGNETILWARNPAQIQEMQQTRENSKYLPHVTLPTDLKMTSLLEQAVQSNIILLACPTQMMRNFLESIKDIISLDAYIVICAKGIEIDSGKLMIDVVSDILPHHCNAVLSGPTFARDVGEFRPTAATLATEDITTARFLASSLSHSYFRLYPTVDRIGVSIAGALKNVIAIAAGICMALNLGDNARASLITRGLAEITRLGCALGAHTETFLGLSGVGDIILTCNSLLSRNTIYGFELAKESGQGSKKDREDTVNTSSHSLTEGVYTAKAAMKLALFHEIELPITEAIYRILYENSSIDNEIQSLLSRPLKIES